MVKTYNGLQGKHIPSLMVYLEGGMRTSGVSQLGSAYPGDHEYTIHCPASHYKV